ETSSGIRKFDRWLRLSHCVRLRRSPSHLADGATHALQIPKLQWREPADAVSICSYWNFLLLVSVEPDPSSGILLNRNWRRRPSLDSADVFPFPMVRRTGRALWPKRSTHHRPSHCRGGVRSVRSSFRGSHLL